ncbi:S1C family serine protease [Deinococcus xianganensis]|uniref:PDZ domain-containing protein n=1 Tax=Deinococcus xianganensis TaxID=1507289 RepID=A0A6I4YFH6_9DEIO|nr:S1C family serine protease [Deinococcus xianganensis]MXV19160.1 PDZ domain-containing protein [Deinococcus xianganensis]
MNLKRAPGVPARPALLAPLLTALLVTLPHAGSQTAPATPGTPTTPQERRVRSGAPLSATEQATLQTLVSRVRPATVRVEQCRATQCDDPDGLGSGVLISEDGLILTAYHVIRGAPELSVQLLNKTRYPAQVIGYNDQDDLALLRVNVPKGTPFLPLAAARPAVGDTALAIGNGGGAFLTPKTGRLLGLDSDAGRADFPPGTLEMNAPLIPGDSGGPVVNVRGEVTGIVSYIRVTQSGQPRSYAVPVSTTDARVAAMQRGEKRDAPMIGIGLGGVFSDLFFLPSAGFQELTKLLNLGDTPGAFFTSVTRNSPAAQAGLKPLILNGDSKRVSGDIVTAVNGKRIVNFAEFQYAVRAYQPGDTVTLSVLRDGKPLEVKVTLVGRSKLSN